MSVQNQKIKADSPYFIFNNYASNKNQTTQKISHNIKENDKSKFRPKTSNLYPGARNIQINKKYVEGNKSKQNASNCSFNTIRSGNDSQKSNQKRFLIINKINETLNKNSQNKTIGKSFMIKKNFVPTSGRSNSYMICKNQNTTGRNRYNSLRNCFEPCNKMYLLKADCGTMNELKTEVPERSYIKRPEIKNRDLIVPRPVSNMTAEFESRTETNFKKEIHSQVFNRKPIAKTNNLKQTLLKFFDKADDKKCPKKINEKGKMNLSKEAKSFQIAFKNFRKKQETGRIDEQSGFGKINNMKIPKKNPFKKHVGMGYHDVQVLENENDLENVDLNKRIQKVVKKSLYIHIHFIWLFFK